MKPVILGSFAPPALACIRSWGRQGWQPGFICVRSDKESEPASRYLKDWVSLPRKKLYTDEGISIISDFLSRFGASGISCIEENISCWLNDHRNKLPEKTAIWLPGNQMIRDVLSKKRQSDIAAAVGFDVLPTYLFDHEKNLAVKTEHFPLCLRPSEPGSIKPGFKAQIVYSYHELEKFILSLTEISHPIIAQPFKSLPNLVVHGARTMSGTTLAMEGFLVARKFEGVTLTIAPFDIDAELRQKCIAFTDAFDIIGNYHFEFLFDPESKAAYFLEINTRFGGTTAKVLPCGYDEPLIALESYGVMPNNRQKIKHLTVSDRMALMKYLLYSLTNRLSPLDYPDEPLLKKICKTLWGFIVYGDDVFNISDMRGALALYWENITGKLRK